MQLGWMISLIVTIVLGNVFAIVIATLNKKVVKDKEKKIDFKQSDIYFYWTRWDYIIIISGAYAFICLIGLAVCLFQEKTINDSWVQFFLHQAVIFSMLTGAWCISRLAYVFKGIKERWSDEFK
ncbi:hypothetical protein SAMN04487944_1264 [Gracilibacillus ureilyticus]|uniref:Uncharacterized protein n=1 Tax=Gracilibacillus ureilyticus TaxID=531814 RepID=A0A1H9VPZ7_9BACI|nr:hypothetical protein [Gracilibacillus ureilyticus]SES23628.1 hypothetical protein SAMN04487944_1264 [Gracilibacillus ureilyticus]